MILKVKELRILAAKKCVPLTQQLGNSQAIQLFAQWELLRISTAVEKNDLLESQKREAVSKTEAELVI